MKVLYGLNDPAATIQESVVAIGNFDGVHRGHQAIVATALRYARPANVPMVVLTFDPHPVAVVTPDRVPQLLTHLHQKLEHLRRIGVDVTIIAASTKEFLSIEPEAFIRDVLVGRLNPLHVVEGRNFGFGHRRRGNVETLARHAKRYGYLLHVVEPVQQELVDGSTARVSSSLIRELLHEGQVEVAAKALGRPYVLEGKVTTGDDRGAPLGFPTANLDAGGQLVPADGVYSGSATVDDTDYRCAVSIGSTPTFDGTTRRVEAYLLGFDGDLYGQSLSIHLHRWLRSQKRFNSRADLSSQIQADVEQIRQEPI